jgi:hypothetical protein
MVAKLLVGVCVAAAMVPALPEPTGPVAQAVEISQGAAQPRGPIQLTPEHELAVKKLHEQVMAARQEEAASPDETEIVCGLKIMRVNPDFDPGFHKQIPEAALNAKIRRITPPACRRETAAAQTHTVTIDVIPGFATAGPVKPPKR